MSFSKPTAFVLFSFFILTAVLFLTGHHDNTISYAQFQNNISSSSTLLGVNITSPQKGQQIPVNINNLTISGKSTDKTATDDCQVSVIVNAVKPYQPVIANGTTEENNDYSRWFFILNSNYTSIKEGTNKITSKLSCLPTVIGADNDNMTKWYSINVTGIPTRNEATISPESPPVTNSSQFVPNNAEEQQHLEPLTNEVQEEPILDSNNNNKKIGKEIENLRERIMDQVEEGLGDLGIELNLP